MKIDPNIHNKDENVLHEQESENSTPWINTISEHEIKFAQKIYEWLYYNKCREMGEENTISFEAFIAIDKSEPFLFKKNLNK